MRARLALILCVVAASPAAGRETLGWYGRWGAFRDAPDRCFARVGPSAGKGGLAVGTAPGAGVRVQIHLDLPRPARADSLILTVGDRRFALISADRDAWPGSPRADLAVLAALRTGRSAELRGVDQSGGRFRAVFPLAGAPSAIDAALVGCLPR